MSFDRPTIPGNITWDLGSGSARISSTGNPKPSRSQSWKPAKRQAGRDARALVSVPAALTPVKHVMPRYRGCPSQGKRSGVGKLVLTARAGDKDEALDDILQRAFISDVTLCPHPSIWFVCKLFIAIHIHVFYSHILILSISSFPYQGFRLK